LAVRISRRLAAASLRLIDSVRLLNAKATANMMANVRT
jgi:hypothetical protein